MWRIDLEAFDGAQHRDGGSDGAVTIEQCCTDQAQDQQGRSPAAGRRIANVQQREQGNDAALATIVRAQDEDGVLERDDQDERPQHER